MVPALIEALKDREAAVRNEAALALWRYMAEAFKSRGGAMISQIRAAAISLIEVVKHDRDTSVRASAAFAAASLLREFKDAGIESSNSSADDPIDPKTLVKAISAVLESDPAARLGLLAAIRRLGPIDQPPPRVILAALDDPSRIVRIEALQAIAEFTSGVDKAVPVLLNDAESCAGRAAVPGLATRLSAAPGCRATATHGRRPSALDQGTGKPQSRRARGGRRPLEAARPGRTARNAGLDHRDQVHDPVRQGCARAGRRPVFL